MCGINGVVGRDEAFPIDQAILLNMREKLAHRGPDDDGGWQGAGVSLGMRRLSIIDLDGGQQPICNEDESIWLIFNGEIYNYLELRQTLIGRGHQFRSETDSEVIVHAFEEYGARCVEHFNGMFALAIWDVNERSLFLARDRLGIKPLYYWEDGEQLAFASELKSLLAYKDVPRNLSPLSLDLFLALEYVPAPYTIFEGVKKLPAGHWLQFQDGQATISKYWDIKSSVPPATLSEAVEQFRDLVEDSVRLRLRSDVPVGAFLSGGIDSSTVLHSMHQLHGAGVPTFSIGFGEASYNELPFARDAAEHFESDHHEAVLDPDITNLVERLVNHFDEPFADFSMFPTFLVSQLAQQSVKVVLSGDGGDEIFAGYDTYVAQHWEQQYYSQLPVRWRQEHLPALLDRVPPQRAKKGLINKAKRFVAGGALPAALEHTRWMIFMDEQAKQALYRPDLRRSIYGDPVTSTLGEYFACAPLVDPLARQQYVDIKTYLVENILTKVDRMSMATSLEVRVPLLDHRLVEFALNLPPEMRLHNGKTKVIMREAMQGLIPDTILNKPKQGFSIPLKHWLRTTLRPMMADLLHEETIAQRGLFNKETIQQWQKEHQSGEANHSHRLWALMVFELWCQNLD